MQEDTYERTFEQNEELGLNDIKVRSPAPPHSR